MDRLALVCEQIARRAGKLEKIEILAAYLSDLVDEDFALAVQFLSAGPAGENVTNYHLFAPQGKDRLAIGGAVLREALRAAVEWDRETMRLCFSEVGDTGETASLLLNGKTAGEPLSLQAANAFYQELFRAGTVAHKRHLLTTAFLTYRSLTIKYLVKVITRGLRMGLMGRMVEEAVARSCSVPNAAIRDANNRLGDLAAVALAARRGTLDSIGARLFHPMDFMLAKALERVEDLADPAAWVFEEKYDGIRSQIHFENGRVQVFSRGMDDVTYAFPEVQAAFSVLPGSGVIDGEILAWREGRALNFNVLQQRLARKNLTAALLSSAPVVFMGYDILLRNGVLLLDSPLESRRHLLAELLVDRTLPLMLSPQYAATITDEIEALFSGARARGNEGLLLKRKASLYESGRRSGAWHKLKRPFGTLDVVVTSAEQGSGRRAIFFSDYTFAVRSGDSFLNIGKAYSGLTDSEVKELTKALRSASLDRFGPTLVVRPTIVLEVAFDGVQKSARHKSGYALRFPRILRWRRDKEPGDCDDLARVEELYQASLR